MGQAEDGWRDEQTDRQPDSPHGPPQGELVPPPRPPAGGTHGLSRGRKGLHLFMCHPHVSCGLKDPGVLWRVIEGFWIGEG